MRTFRPVFACAVLASVPLAAQSVPTRGVGRPTAQYGEPFSEVRAVRELTDGRIIVVDGRELTVQLVDLARGEASTIGRPGSGPGEYRWPGALFMLPGDSTLLQDQAGGRLLILRPDGKPGDIYDPNAPRANEEQRNAFRFIMRFSDARGYLYASAQPIRTAADGTLELADSAAIERLDRATGKRDTVAMWPRRADDGARLFNGMVMTQPKMIAFPAWDQWTVSPDGRIAFVWYDPYRVDFVGPDGRVTQGAPIPYQRIRVDDALRKEWMDRLNEPRMGMSYGKDGSTAIGPIRAPAREPSEWPEYLPPYQGSAMFASDNMLWIPRYVAAGMPPLYDIVDGNGRLVQRVELPAKTKLVGFGRNSLYLVQLDDDDLQYLRRYALPTSNRP